ncbi:MAG TPA: FtsQ-type POTRA domain-containing protein [Terriglobia bacterium]|nr:FtsQ-type POTRA domain-containing protein [Terriglobia bacterium]
MNAPLPLPDELRIEEPNPYRRRQKVIGIRRGPSRASRVARTCALALTLALALPLGAYWAGRRIIASRLFLFQPHQDVKLIGNHVVSTDDVLNALGYGNDAESPATSFFRMDLARERQRVDFIPWVESATIERMFPNRLRITVVERTPVAYAQVNGSIELVDQNGIFLQMLRKSPLDFPVLYGLDAAASISERKAMIGRYEQFLSDTRAEMRRAAWSVSEVDLSDPDDLRVLLVQGKLTILAHFGDGDYTARFKTFTTVAPQALAANPKIDSMDLRYPGEVVVDPAGQDTVAAASGAVKAPQRRAKPTRRARARRH